MRKHGVSRIVFIFCLVAALLAAAVTLAACNGKDTPKADVSSSSAPLESFPAETFPAEPEETDVVFFSGKQTSYRLVRATGGASAALSNCCNDLGDAINKYMLIGGEKYLYADRDTSDATEFEILVGPTNRPESAEVVSSLGKKDFAVKIVGKKLVIVGIDDDSSIEAVNWFIKNFIEGRDSLALPEDFCYVRSKAPKISSLSQEDLYWDLSTDSPEITAEIVCPGGAPLLVGFSVDGHDVTDAVKLDGWILKMSGISFENGMHRASIILSTPDGFCGYESFQFGTGECENMNLYKGEVHAHTSDSDGIGTAEEAYTYARDVAKLDFFAVTDHSNSYPEANYKSIHVPLADSFNEPGKFVALCGYEETYSYTSGYYGHLNTINTPVYALRSEPLESYYNKMTKAAGAIVQFNHPGYSWGNFLEYDLYTPKYDKVVNLFEFKGSGYDNEWALCLAKGWHVSPMHNEDNHQGKWGTVNEAVGYVLAPSLTRQNITEAMTMNRSYTTTDQTLLIYFKINDVWMGGRLDNPDKLNVSVSLRTRKNLGTVQIIAEDNVVVASCSAGNKRELEWNLTLEPEYDYYYVKVNANGFAVTAPVWVENRDKINITGMDRKLISSDNGSDKDHRVSATFRAEAAMTDVNVKFYQSALGGFDITKEPCVGEKKIGNMAAGETAEAFSDVAYSQAKPRITAVVTGKIGEGTYSDTFYIQLTPLLFSEICASASGYSYVELFNATADPVDLSNYKIRIWPKTGAKSDQLSEKTFVLSGTVPAHSATVVWLHTDKNLTLADFNRKFGCSLSENGGIVILDSNWSAPTTKGVQIEILGGTTVISRAQYNFGTSTADVAECKSVLFTYQKEYTLTAVKKKLRQDPTPGVRDPDLMPELIDKAS